MSRAWVTVDPAECTPEDLAAPVAWLRAGGIVAFPTDTVYGLAVDPSSPAAVAALFDLKGRAADAAVPLLAASAEQVRDWCGAINPATALLAARFWPGPLSLLFDAPTPVTPAIHAGTYSVAVRVPAHVVARALARAAGVVTATSANRTGELPAVEASDLRVIAADPRVFVIDAGPAPGGAASTIVDARGSHPRLIRDGAIAWERVLESLHE